MVPLNPNTTDINAVAPISNITIRHIVNDFVFRTINGQPILVPLHSRPDKIVELNSSALYLWNITKIHIKLEKLVQSYADKYRLSYKSAYQECTDFYNSLTCLSQKIESPSKPELISKAQFPAFLTWELTGQCNLNCRHCYARSLRVKPPLTIQECIKIIDELYDLGCFYLTFTGGECTLHPDFKDIYKYARKKGFCISLLTNATLLKERKLVSVLRRYPPFQVKVSLYGPSSAIHDSFTQTKGSYKQTIENVQALVSQGTNVWFSGLVTTKNQNYVQEMKKLAQDLGTDIFFYRSFIPTLTGDSSPLNHQSKTLSLKKLSSINDSFSLSTKPEDYLRTPEEIEYVCSGGKTTCHLDSQGNLGLCMMERSTRFSVKKSFSAAFKKLQAARASLVSLPKPCFLCPQKTNCRICPTRLRFYQKTSASTKICDNINYDNSCKGETL